MALYSQNDLILQAYRLLETTTPLPIDCGTLCAHACCQGDEHTGMWLLPGEEALLKDETDFSILPCEDNAGHPMLVCKGRCDRKKRPFACRIFPLFPLVKETEKGGIRIEIIVDPRAGIVCPLRDKEMTAFRFRRRVRQAAIVLLGDPALRRYLIETGAFLEELQAFQDIMSRK